jgi:predicted nuclease of predicted toxin-antitoxin system
MTEGLDELEDQYIWKFAKENEFTIITKDSDFNELVLVNGFPPQIIWIRLGNCKIADIEQIIRTNAIILVNFHRHQESGILEVG